MTTYRARVVIQAIASPPPRRAGFATAEADATAATEEAKPATAELLDVTVRADSMSSLRTKISAATNLA